MFLNYFNQLIKLTILWELILLKVPQQKMDIINVGFDKDTLIQSFLLLLCQTLVSELKIVMFTGFYFYVMLWDLIIITFKDGIQKIKLGLIN